MRKKCLFVLPAFLLWPFLRDVAAQDRVTVWGTVADTSGVPVSGANIMAEGTGRGTTSGTGGRYELALRRGRIYVIVASHVGYLSRRHVVDLRTPKETLGVACDFTLDLRPQRIPEVTVVSERLSGGTLQRLETKDFRHLPNPAGGIETLLKTLPGVSSGNELSSQYSVRGGSFDENLVYVNDIEVHRPALVRSGQQEGLSFVNPDLVESVDFSAGGFDVRYGDKMSSVLDVRYREPEKFAASASAGLLGASASAEGLAAGKRFSYLVGARYKTSQYLLGTLDTKGEYNPAFFDVQGLFRYRPGEKWELNLLAHAAQNVYLFVPESRTSGFGTLYNAYSLKVYYDGQEVDRYAGELGALTVRFRPTAGLWLKLTGTTYRSRERETFDIEAAYRLDELNAASAGVDSVANIGMGSELSHARNYLNVKIDELAHAGMLQGPNGSLRWSVACRRESTDSRMNEWVMLDSAGYSVPYDGESLRMKSFTRADSRLDVTRFISYLQYRRKWRGAGLDWTVTAGVRLNYGNANREWLFSPRISITVSSPRMPQLTGHFAAGMYGQPPSGRELRNAGGHMNAAVKAQRSVHYVAGGCYEFDVGQKPFKLSAEIYCKRLSRLVPYRMENVRVYYADDNIASGYIVGGDVRLNGEFVKGAESWVGLSLMHARGNMEKDGHGSFPLPTDQLVNFNLFFRDYIPGAPAWRVFLNLVFGSSLPYGYPVADRYDRTFRMPAYRRADTGFSRQFFREERSRGVFRQIWMDAEVFNLFDTRNTVSYLWVQVVANRDGHALQYAVPNYLTARRISIKLSMAF